MAHLCAPCVLAMVIATPFLSGSIFEEGTVRKTCEGDKMEGKLDAAPCDVDAGIKSPGGMDSKFPTSEEP